MCLARGSLGSYDPRERTFLWQTRNNYRICRGFCVVILRSTRHDPIKICSCTFGSLNKVEVLHVQSNY